MKALKRKVQFDFGALHDPTSGKHVEVKGEFQKPLCRFERDDIGDKELEKASKFLNDWISEFFETETNPEDFEQVVETAIIFITFAYPLQPIGTPKFNLATQCLAFLWLLDDIMESCVAGHHTISEHVFETGMAELLQIFRYGTSTFDSEKLKSFPSFQALSNLCLQLFQDFEKLVPNYKKTSKQFFNFVQNSFEAHQCYFKTSLDGTLPEETFREWRRVSGLFMGSVEVFWILENDNGLPSEILKFPTFPRVWFLVDSIGACTNDLLGMKKEFENEQFESLLVFKVIQKNIPIANAVAQLCEIIEDNVTEYLEWRENILSEFSYHPELVKYIDVIEAAMYGHCKVYMRIRRYKAVGSIKLI